MGAEEAKDRREFPHSATPLDRRLDTPPDSEETDVLRTDPATTDTAPHQDPDWRPGLLPRDNHGRPVASTTKPTPASGDDADMWSAVPDTGTPLSPPPGSSAVPPPRTTRRGFDPMSMVAGFFFMGIAVTYLLDAGNAVDARPGIMLALAVIGVGASGFIGAVWATITGYRNRKRTTATRIAEAPPAAD